MSDDTFATVVALIALISDAKACKARLEELRQLSEQIAAQRAALDAATQASQVAITEGNRDLDRRRAKITEGEVDLRLRRDAFDQREARRTHVSDDLPIDPNFGPGTRHPNGMARGPE
jgi:hypothetical protein